jgi:integrase
MVAQKVLRFTKKGIDSLPAPVSGRAVYHDSEVRGLTLRVSASSKIFYLYKRVQGSPRRIRIGPFPAVTVSQARTQVRQLLADIATGRLSFSTGQISTLSGLWERYLETYAEPYCRPQTVTGHRQQWTCYLEGKFGNRRPESITRQELQEFHTRLGKDRGRTTANRALALLSILYNKAIDWDLLPLPVNPASRVRRFREHSRSRFVTADEMPAFLAAVEDAPDLIRDFIKILLFTGGRKASVQGARWEQFDPKADVWTIPARLSKPGRAYALPMVSQAVVVLDARPRAGPWVFPGRSRAGYLTQPHKGWHAVLSAAGLSGLTPHDLRRTLATWMGDTGASTPLIRAMLGHKPKDVTDIYARANLEPTRAAMQAAVNAMLSCR